MERDGMGRSWYGRGLALAALTGVLSGLASGLFLDALRRATEHQTNHRWLLFLLPVGGAVIAWLYRGYGASAVGGNNLILDHIHESRKTSIPLRMFPLILITTVLTHLFGGSAGREGVAVQMGGAIASQIARVFRLDSAQTRLLLMCGISGGFASIFGTPLAGTIFGMEMLAIGGISYEALIPCLIAALAGNQAIHWLGIEHGHYAINSAIPALGPDVVAKVAVAAVVFGLLSAAFSESIVLLEREWRALFKNPVVKTTVGGGLVIAATLALGTRAYNGLSLPLLSAPFTGQSVPSLAFLAKLGLTALTLSVGFKGGEVTPLFVIGATAGATFAGPLGLPVDFLAALGFVAVFAAAANTPLACVAMGAELFGSSGIIYFGIAIFIAYTISGHRGIYRSQRLVTPKRLHQGPFESGAALGSNRSASVAYSTRLATWWTNRKE